MGGVEEGGKRKERNEKRGKEGKRKGREYAMYNMAGKEQWQLMAIKAWCTYHRLAFTSDTLQRITHTHREECVLDGHTPASCLISD